MKALQLTAADSVATALQEIEQGCTFDVIISGDKVAELIASETIPYGFKVCTREMRKGQDVVKYGHVIGKASQDICVGQLVHVHNIEGNRGRGDLAQK